MNPTVKKSSPTDERSFINTQHRFTQYIRNPDSAPIPSDIEKRRADIYRDLFFNNLQGFLADNFPVLRKVSSDEDWNTLVRDFFSRHQSSSPYFSQIPTEFIHFLQHERAANEQSVDDPPFITELAHYEWAELLAATNDGAEQTRAHVDNIEQQLLTLSVNAYPLAYQYPVHNISPEFIPSEAPDTASYLVVYRNADDEVVFLETNPVTHALLEKLANNSQQHSHAILTKLATEMHHPNPDVVIQGGLSILRDFIERGIIVAVG